MEMAVQAAVLFQPDVTKESMVVRVAAASSLLVKLVVVQPVVAVQLT